MGRARYSFINSIESRREQGPFTFRYLGQQEINARYPFVIGMLIDWLLRPLLSLQRLCLRGFCDEPLNNPLHLV